MLLAFGLMGRCILRGGGGNVCLLFQIPLGALFFFVASWWMVEAAIDTQRCREAEAKGDFQSVSGRVHVIERHPKPVAGYIRFSVGDRVFTTHTSGLSCDCGYIMPVGMPVRIGEGMEVEMKVRKNKIIALKVTSAG